MPLLELCLTAPDVVDEGFRLPIPRVAALEEEAYSVEGHPRTTAGTGLVGIDMEEQPVHAETEIAVEEGFNHGGSLVPGAPDLSETFGLDDVLAVDMGTADGIKHVARLIVRR